MSQFLKRNSRTLCLSVSAMAILAAGAASAQTTVLTPTSGNYDINSSTDTVVEISSGTNAYFARDGMQWALPANTPGLFVTTVDGWKNGVSGDSYCTFSWECAKSSAPLIKVDSGATLTFGGTQWQSWYSGGQDLQSLIAATGDVIFQGGGTWTFLGTNSFLGNVTVLDGANLAFGWDWANATTTFGPKTNIDLQGNSQLTFWNSGTMTVGGRISGSSASVIALNKGTLIVNGQNTSAAPFAGTINIGADQMFMVGDSTHTTAVFGDPVANSAKINLTSTTATLAGYGTVDGIVTNTGIVKAGGTKGIDGNLTINGSFTQTSTGQLYTSFSPTGVSGLVVNGNASLAGELIISIAEGTYGNAVYPLVNVKNGKLTGTFATVSTAGNVAGAMVGVMQTASGYSIVTESGSAAQVFGHLVYANRVALSNFVGSIYDAMATTPVTGAKIDTFVTPYGSIENLGRDGQGYEEKAYGLTVGGMHRFAAHGGVVGAAFSYRHGNMSVKDDPATASTNTYNLAVYGGADVNLLRIDGSAFYSLYDADTNRPMSTFGTSKAGQTGFAWGFSGQMGRPMFGSRLMPYVRATYARIHLSDATESGSVQFDLKHDAINQNSFMVDLGLRFQLIRPEGERHWRLDADIAARHDLSDPGETISGGFANFASGTSVSYWRGDSKNTLRIGLNAADQITDRLELYGRLDGALTSHRRAGELTAGVKYKF